MKLGILSDAHGNLEAFQQGLRLLEAAGAEELIFLGDALGYLPGLAVLDALIALDCQCILGNHEAMLLEQDPALQAKQSHLYGMPALREALTSSQRAALASWPARTRIQRAGQRLELLHGSPEDPTNGYLYPDTPLDAALAALPDPAPDYLLSGHSHRAMDRRGADTRFVNPGSCGMPRGQGAERFHASVALLDLTRPAQDPSAVQHLYYDISAAISRAALDDTGGARVPQGLLDYWGLTAKQAAPQDS